MQTIASRSEDVVRRFFDAYLHLRDLDKTLECLADDIRWIGTGDFERAGKGFCDCRELLIEEFKATPGSFNVKLRNLYSVEAGKACYTDGDMSVVDPSSGKGVNVRISAMCGEVPDGRCLIQGIHASLPSGEQPDGEETEPAGNGISYTVEADALTEDVLNREIAVCGDDHLTNRELPYYYWQQYYTLMNNYGSYASYFIDASTPFDQQMCMFDDTLTWQQYFLQGAVSTYKSVSALWQDARLSGFQLGEEDQDYLDGLSNTVTVSAASYGYESADAYLQTAYGPAATMTGYHDFVERYLTASAYLQALVEAKTYTEADISAYFDENADTYAASSIEKSDVNMVNVRHILIVPEEKNDDGTYTDAAWTAAEQKAQALLDEWKAGEHTEDSFAFLAAENSADTGSASNGGLYEEVYPGQMVDAFDAWCFDAARQPGDTGIVKTEYGYHVMYFSSVCEHPYWYVRAESDYLNKLSADVSEEVSAKFESAESVQNAALADILQN